MITNQKFDEIDLQEQVRINLKSHDHNNMFAIEEKMADAIEGNEDFSSIFLESPCGSGKTLAVMLPVLEKMARDVHEMVIFTAPSDDLCLQHFEYCSWLLADVQGVRLFSKDNFASNALGLLFMQTKLPMTLIFFGTPQFMLYHLMAAVFDQTAYELQEPLLLVIDEADSQLRSNELIQLCEFLHIRPDTAYHRLTGLFNPELVFSSATLGAKLDLVNSIFVSLGRYLLDENEPASKSFRIQFDPNFVYKMVYCNTIPLPALLVFDDQETLKTVSEKLISRSMSGFVWASLECIVKPFEIEERNIRVASRIGGTRLTKRSLVLADISEIRGIDYQFETVVVAALESEDVQHALGRAGRGLFNGFRIQMIEQDGNSAADGATELVEKELESYCRSIGEPRTKPQWDEIEQCEEMALEDLVCDQQ